MRKHGFRPSERELESMLKSVDKTSHDSGGIDFDEFIELLVNHGRNIEEDIAKSFKVFDIDGDGQINYDALVVLACCKSVNKYTLRILHSYV